MLLSCYVRENLRERFVGNVGGFFFVDGAKLVVLMDCWVTKLGKERSSVSSCTFCHVHMFASSLRQYLFVIAHVKGRSEGREK